MEKKRTETDQRMIFCKAKKKKKKKKRNSDYLLINSQTVITKIPDLKFLVKLFPDILYC